MVIKHFIFLEKSMIKIGEEPELKKLLAQLYVFSNDEIEFPKKNLSFYTNKNSIFPDISKDSPQEVKQNAKNYLDQLCEFLVTVGAITKPSKQDRLIHGKLITLYMCTKTHRFRSLTATKPTPELLIS